MRRYLLILAPAVMAVCFFGAAAQTPAPIVVQAANQTPAAPTKPVAAPTPIANKQSETLQQLNDMLTTNAATIKQQEAALATLDDLQKAADEIKIFSKRG